jgi:hypothetical protein
MNIFRFLDWKVYKDAKELTGYIGKLSDGFSIDFFHIFDCAREIEKQIQGLKHSLSRRPKAFVNCRRPVE